MLFTILRGLISVLQSQRALAVENLALRYQLSVPQRTAKKPRLRPVTHDRPDPGTKAETPDTAKGPVYR